MGTAVRTRLPAALAAGGAAAGVTLLLWFVDHGLGSRQIDPAAARRENVVYLVVGALATTCFLLGTLRGISPRTRVDVIASGAGTGIMAVVALVAGLITMVWLPRRGILVGHKFRPFMAACVTLFLFLDCMLLRDLYTRRERS